jgi:hypothetical protein
MRYPLPIPLPRGIISGIGLPEEHKIDFSSFRSACELAATTMRGSVREIHEANTGEIITYYHEATIVYDYGRRSVRVLCSSFYPVIAFADAGASRSSRILNFVDVPALASALGENLHFVLMSAAEAAKPPASPLTDTLDETEQQEIELLQPPRLGDAVFKR